MNRKIGRNDPCPCGSGKKYKHCCGRPAAPAAPASDAHEGAVERAVAWLAQHYRKAFATALDTAIDDAILDLSDDEAKEEKAREVLMTLNEPVWEQIQLNFTEWLLAEGDIQVKGKQQRVAELLVGPDGPLLTAGQRGWLEQLSTRPLRLYDITEVVPGESITLCDALDTELPPLLVTEHAGSRSLRVGMQIGARVMQVAGQHQLSGAIYPFAAWSGRVVQERLRGRMTEPVEPDEPDEYEVLEVGMEIMDGWLEQYLMPAPLPEIMHGASGEPLLFHTDHYDVLDWDVLTRALAAQPDVDGDRDSGWDLLKDGADGLRRSQARIESATRGRRVSVTYQTAGLAERGRAWFDALAGDSVKFRLREVSDPKGMLSKAGAVKPSAAQSAALPPGLDPETMAAVMETFIHRNYAKWADEPIPVLGDQSPRQAMRSSSGLERVKGLLRSYQDGEAQQAAQQGRREISYQFLWDALGLTK